MTLSQTAKKYIGQRENPGNVFDPQSLLGMKLHEAGQKDGEPWCAYFGEAMAKEADPENAELYDKLFSASAVQTFKNFKEAGFKILVLPEPDTIVVWQKYKDAKPTWQGHLGICYCSEDDGRGYESIEGNTNAGGGREGIEVALKQRLLDYSTRNGLRLLGFIKI